MKLSEAQWAEAILIYQADRAATHDDIAALYGVARLTVQTNFAKRGVPAKRHGREFWPAKRIKKLLELRAQKLSFGAIAARLNISRNAVAGKLDRLAA